MTAVAAPFPDIAAEMPGIQLEREQPVTAIEQAPAPSEEELVDAAAANANFGPQDMPVVLVVEPAADEVPPVPAEQDIVYNVHFDVPGAISAGPDKFDDAVNSVDTPTVHYQAKEVILEVICLS